MVTAWLSGTRFNVRMWLTMVLTVGALWASSGQGGLTNITQSILSVCTNKLLQEVNQAYNTTSELLERKAKLTTAVETFATQCMGLEVQEERALRIMAPKTGLFGLLQQRAAEFEAATGIRVSLNPVEFFEVGAEIKQELELELNDFSDGWVIDPSVTGEVASLEGFKSLDEYIPEDPSIEWNDISRFFRTASAIYDRKVVALPLDGDLLLMYYRQDLFNRYQLSVPQTWDEFVDLAVRMNGTDSDGDGIPDLYGACFDIAYPVCKANFLLTAMAAPYIQYRGTSHGVFYDPTSMRPLINNAAMARAVRHYVDLFAVLPPNATCSASNYAFRSGHCLMTVNWGDEFKANAPRTNGYGLGGSLSVAPLPGATEVLDRATGRLVPCSGPEMCPYAKLVQLANGMTAYVNHAPYSAFGGWAGAVSRLAPPDYQRRAYRFFAFMVQPNNSWGDVLNATTGIDPYRRSQLQVGPGSNFDRWLAAGYDAGSTYTYLTSVNEALESENMVMDSRLEFVGMPVRLIVEAGLHNLTWFQQLNPKATIESTLAVMEQEVLKGLAATGTVDELRRQYCKLIGCTAPPAPTVSPGAAGGGDDSRRNAMVAVYVLVPVTVALIVAISALGMWRRHTQRRHILSGGIKAPGPGPATTILVTDIESSTTLWELLPEDVMSKAVEVHHSLVRRALMKFSGYESATEGDSFICVFHTATGAIQCALWIQQELVNAPWPPALLACPECPAVAELNMTPTHYHGELMGMLAPRGGGGAAAANAEELQHDRSRIAGVWRQCLKGKSEAPQPAVTHSSVRHSQSQLQMPQTSSTPAMGADVSVVGAAAMVAAGGELQSRTPGSTRAAAVIASEGLAAVHEGEFSGSLTDDVVPDSCELPYGDDGGSGGGAVTFRRGGSGAGGCRTQPLVIDDGSQSVYSGTSRTTLSRFTTEQLALALPGVLGDSGVGGGGGRNLRVLIDYVMAAWRPVAEVQVADSSLAPGQPGSEQGSQYGVVPSGLAVPMMLITAAGAAMTTTTTPMGAAGTAATPMGALPKGAGAFWRQPSGAGRARRVRQSHRGPSVRVYRGLRVRIGMASGVDEPTDVSYNAAEARYHYSGTGMRLARAVQGAAAGGMVLLSDSTFAQQRQERTAELPGVLLLHMGQHDLHRDLPPQQMYQAISQPLVGRLACFPPIVVRSCLSAGVLTAPVRRAAIAFVYVVGASSLLAWDAAVARKALGQLEEVFAQELAKNPVAAAARAGADCLSGTSGGGGGYIVEATGGLLLAAFSDPAHAVAACLATVDGLLDVEWPEALLENALCEELAVARLDTHGNIQHEVLFRGLRIKAGLDYGTVHATINEATGRLSYRGRVMNRAARIASSASSGQVLCSRELYDTAMNAVHSPADVFTAISMGAVSLKGLSDPVELMLCRTATRMAAPSRRLSVVLRTEQQITAAMALGLPPEMPQTIPTPRASVSRAPELLVRLQGVSEGALGMTAAWMAS